MSQKLVTSLFLFIEGGQENILIGIISKHLYLFQQKNLYFLKSLFCLFQLANAAFSENKCIFLSFCWKRPKSPLRNMLWKSYTLCIRLGSDAGGWVVKQVMYNELPKMKRDTRQKKQSLSQNMTDFCLASLFIFVRFWYVTALVVAQKTYYQNNNQEPTCHKNNSI